MSSPQEYHYTATPQMPQCQGTSCYCFQGKNQFNDIFSDSDSESECEPYTPPSNGWHIADASDWTVALHQLNFRHPRVLLAYFRFVTLYNELAGRDEQLWIPKIPTHVSEFILSHVSIRQTPEEFKNEVNELRFYVNSYT